MVRALHVCQGLYVVIHGSVSELLYIDYCICHAGKNPQSKLLRKLEQPMTCALEVVNTRVLTILKEFPAVVKDTAAIGYLPSSLPEYRD